MLKTRVDSFDGRVHTLDYRIYGGIHPRVNTSMADYLNSPDRPFLPVTHAMAYRSGFLPVNDLDTYQAAPVFMAVPKERILWIVGGIEHELEPMAYAYENRSIAICYTDYFLLGDMRVMPNTRSSDHFNTRAMQRPFQALHNVSLALLQDGTMFTKGEVIETFDLVTVNLKNVASICEVEASTADMLQSAFSTT